MEYLAEKVRACLPPYIADIITRAGIYAAERGEDLYLVGGVVRDLFLGRRNLDLDLAVEGYALRLAEYLAGVSGARLTVHQRFGTAKLKYDKFSLDLATVRKENYPFPGSLPVVERGTILDDLARRDFTINAMAVRLTTGHFGELLDPHKGKNDIAGRLIRVLHAGSFIDDATRIFRALRYEQRLEFSLSTETMGLLERDLDMIATISGTRLRHELEAILVEEYPERVIVRADELGVLPRLHPSLRGDDTLKRRYEQSRLLPKRDSRANLNLCLLIYPLADEELAAFIARFGFSNRVSELMRQTIRLKQKAGYLDSNKLKASEVYHFLRRFSIPAIEANMFACLSPRIRDRLRDYLLKLRYVRVFLTGDDLQQMGVSAGPELGRMLNLLRNARLNGEVTSVAGEREMVRIWRETSQEP